MRGTWGAAGRLETGLLGRSVGMQGAGGRHAGQGQCAVPAADAPGSVCCNVDDVALLLPNRVKSF